MYASPLTCSGVGTGNPHGALFIAGKLFLDGILVAPEIERYGCMHVYVYKYRYRYIQ